MKHIKNVVKMFVGKMEEPKCGGECGVSYRRLLRFTSPLRLLVPGKHVKGLFMASRLGLLSLECMRLLLVGFGLSRRAWRTNRLSTVGYSI